MPLDWPVVRATYRINMYPIAFVSLSPLSAPHVARFPAEFREKLKLHERLLLVFAVPKPMYESEDLHLSCPSFPMIPSRTLTLPVYPLKPSWLQLGCSDDIASGISDFHVLRPRFVARYLPSANKLLSELAGYLKEMKRTALPTFIPIHISLKEVLQ